MFFLLIYLTVSLCLYLFTLQSVYVFIHSPYSQSVYVFINSPYSQSVYVFINSPYSQSVQSSSVCKLLYNNCSYHHRPSSLCCYNISSFNILPSFLLYSYNIPSFIQCSLCFILFNYILPSFLLYSYNIPSFIKCSWCFILFIYILPSFLPSL